MIGRHIDHTAIVVADLDAALARYAAILGAEPSSRDVVPDQEVEIAFLPIGDTQLELIMPTTADSGVARYLAKRGEGLHHVAILVEDIDRELARLEGEGVPLIDRQSRPGPHGRVAFVRPEALGGVLLELIERPEPID